MSRTASVILTCVLRAIVIGIIFRSVVATDAYAQALSATPICSSSIVRVNVSSDGQQANGSPALGFSGSIAFGMSVDGRYVLFRSDASNLVPQDTNGVEDIFVHDQLSGTTERVSVSSEGTQGNFDAGFPAISGDGRFVAFYSDASNLVPDDTNGVSDIFVHDRLTGVTERVSVSPDGTQADNSSVGTYPGLSNDGRFVVFESNASNLIPGKTTQSRDIFVRDRLNRITERVSISSSGQESDRDSDRPSISGDGRYVTFASTSPLIAQGLIGYVDRLFVHDRSNGTTTAITSGNLGALAAQRAALSSDGRYIAFSSGLPLVPEDSNSTRDVFVYDQLQASFERISVSSMGTEADNASGSWVDISADGRYVVFNSFATNLVGDDTNGTTTCPVPFVLCCGEDIFLRDRHLGTTDRLSKSTAGAQANCGANRRPWISADGRYVAFDSHASNLVPADTNSLEDVFVRDTRFGQPSSFCCTTDADCDDGNPCNGKEVCDPVQGCMHGTRPIEDCSNGIDDDCDGFTDCADLGCRLDPSCVTPNKHRLSISLDGLGHGHVTSKPAGIDCPPQCTALFKSATHVSLTAQPQPGSLLIGWDAPKCSRKRPCNVILRDDVNVRTIFSKPLPPSPKIIYIGVCGAGGLLDANECYTHGGWYDPATIPAFAYDNPLRDDDLNDIALTVNSGLDSIGLRIGALFTNSVTIVAGFDLGLAPFGSSVVTDLVRSFYVPGDQIYLAGHSMGGYIVDNVAAALKRAKVPVQAVLQLDSVRPSKAIALPPPSIPSNVHRAFNVYHSCDLSACPICGYSTIVTTASTVVSNLAIVAPEGPDTLAGCGPHRNMDNDPRGWRPFMDYIIATFSNTVHASVAVTRKTTTRENTQSLE